VLGQRVIRRSDRVLLPAANDGLLLWESLRRAPEGLCAALVSSETAREALLRYAATLDEDERPLAAVSPDGLLPGREEAEGLFGCAVFDHILCREPWRRNGNKAAFAAFAEKARALLAPGGGVSLLQSPPRLGGRVSRVLAGAAGDDAALIGELAAAEEAFFGSPGPWDWTAEELAAAFTASGFAASFILFSQKEERLLTPGDIAPWFDAAASSWGAFISGRLGEAAFARLHALLLERVSQGPVEWRWQSALVKGETAGSGGKKADGGK